MIKVSVALCTYNGAKFLAEQLESIINQSYKNLEIVVCDDVSNDETISILEKYKKISEIEIKIYRNINNLGSTKNFEKAILNCTGDIIFLCDQDDVWEKEKISIILGYFKPSINLVFSNAKLINSKGDLLENILISKQECIKITKTIKDMKIFDYMLKKSIMTGATIAFKKEFVNKITPISEFFVHDLWIGLIISAINPKSIYFANESLIKYRCHENQQIGLNNDNLIEKRRKHKLKNLIEYELIGYQELYNSFNRLHLNENYIKKIKDRMIHLELRNKYSEKNIFLKLNLFKEIFNLRYFRYSNGLYSLIRDFGIFKWKQ